MPRQNGGLGLGPKLDKKGWARIDSQSARGGTTVAAHARTTDFGIVETVLTGPIGVKVHG
jgi:hypothetical protein